ncbi:anti-sigma factor family protein [Xanthovirga aplysinae]|uniref:anti-sigma factor family protein n=1 Tax=Xanthovirga aplysinae TaxID=2529853 RepID=UPI0012BD492D|nr:zf-HC2 domain-containing protein [Xanthovirga aplysinae]MTI30265.1 hypothetical protein [Xanthovirga aplysinae]
MAVIGQTRKEELSNEISQVSCGEVRTFLPLIHQQLDGEISPEEESQLNHHLEKCAKCRQMLRLEQAIKDALQVKLEKKPLPKGLVNSIKLQIKHTTA